MKRTLQIIGDVFAAPSEAFTQIKQHPTCLGMFLLLSVVSTGSGWTVLPYYLKPEMLEIGTEGAKMPQVQAIADLWLAIVFFLPPLPLLIKCVIFAGLLYLGVRFLGNTQSLTFIVKPKNKETLSSPRQGFCLGVSSRFPNRTGVECPINSKLYYKPMFAAVVYSELILVCAALINAVLLVCFREVDDIQNKTDYQVISSLHLIFEQEKVGLPYSTFLSQITPFSVWYLYVLSRGVAIIGDLSWRTAVWLVAVIWLASVGVQVAIVVLEAL